MPSSCPVCLPANFHQEPLWPSSLTSAHILPQADLFEQPFFTASHRLACNFIPDLHLLSPFLFPIRSSISEAMAPPPPTTLPLGERVKRLATTLQFVRAFSTAKSQADRSPGLVHRPCYPPLRRLSLWSLLYHAQLWFSMGPIQLPIGLPFRCRNLWYRCLQGLQVKSQAWHEAPADPLHAPWR